MDEDGYVFIVDRKKDVIKPSGFQVWPREVEEVIADEVDVELDVSEEAMASEFIAGPDDIPGPPSIPEPKSKKNDG